MRERKHTMNESRINKMLELLDDHLEKTRDLDGDDAERAEEFYKGMFTMAEYILTAGDSKRSVYKGIEYGGIGEPHHYAVRKDS